MTISSDADHDPDVIDTETAAAILGRTKRQLEKWRVAKKPFGPKSWAINARGDRRYSRKECEQWAKEHPR